ncbi:MAG TPA: prenyltransferase/squalene oxidase repeat-containing protein [Planctomycetota bacterium]|nr:prenyltransferase/squalene oxidase repeat-containing protein [Planctomycetota bacterium]
MQAYPITPNDLMPEPGGTTSVQVLPIDVKETVPFLESLAAKSSWWAVSILLHALVILLAGLMSMAIDLGEEEPAVVMVTELAHRTVIETEVPKPKSDLATTLLSQHDTPPTDPTSTEASNIVVPPEILEKAELGDHFETINPDRPDTQSAFGNPDAHMFHSTKGSDDEAGGGGTGGVGLEDLIGVGGLSSPGTGGGWGGGSGTGTGVDKGSGHGSFGSRNGGGRKLMIKKHGGSAATEGAVELALDWLARHQEADGSWSVRKTEGQGDWDPGVTGLATLAFLGAGHTEKVGKYKENVQKAVAWMIAGQREDGALGSDPKFTEHHGGFSYHHAICGLALAEAAGMANIPTTRKAAQKAVDYSCNIHQAGEGSEKMGWRYQPKSPGDVSATGWYVMQLKSAKIAGLQVDAMAFDGAIRFLDSCEESPDKVQLEDKAYDDGRHRYGYTGKGAMVNTTSIGVLCRLFMGWKKDEFTGAALWLRRTNSPEWRKDLGLANGGGWPMYYMYYTTLTMFQLGGDHWPAWNEPLKKVLLENQRKDGDFRGSWDALSPWESKAGRTYTTALGVLCLEVYYRYQQLR